MGKKPTPVQIEEFLSGLHERKSQGERAQAAHFIRKHRRHVDAHVDRKRAEGREELARYYEKLLAKHEEGPAGVFYSESLHSIRSFRPSFRASHSLTFPTQHKTARVVGWLLAALFIGLTLYFGSLVADYARDVGGHVATERERATENVGE